MNEIVLCLEDPSASGSEMYQGHVDHCVTYSTLNISETVRDSGYGSKGPPIGNGIYGLSSGHMTDDVT